MQPGQKLIESPSGLRIVTTSTPNRPDRKVAVKTELPKMVPKVSSSTQEGETQKNPIIIRQQVAVNSTNVIVKSVTNKSVTSSTPAGRSVVLNNGQVLGMFRNYINSFLTEISNE